MNIKTLLTAVSLMVACAVGASATTFTSQALLSDCTTYSVMVTTGPTPLFSPVLASATTSFPRIMENRTFLEIQNSTATAAVNIFIMTSLSDRYASNYFTLPVPPSLANGTGRKLGPLERLPVSSVY